MEQEGYAGTITISKFFCNVKVLFVIPIIKIADFEGIATFAKKEVYERNPTTQRRRQDVGGSYG